MIPGPSQPAPEVLKALSRPVLPHYGEQWKEVYSDTTAKLAKVFGTRKADVILVPIPGQVAAEMAVFNLVGRGGTGFVCVNGVFSGLIPQMIGAIGGKARVITAPLGRGFVADDVASVLDSTRDVSGKPLFLVHTETSTGASSNAAEIFRICRKRGVMTVLDSISAFGGTEVKMDEWGVDYVLGYSSKALGGVFGANPVAVGAAAWERARSNVAHINTYFLNLNTWRNAIERDSSWGHPYPSSMPTSVIVALQTALDMALKEGLENRYKRHAAAASETREGLAGLGLPAFTKKEFYSNTVSVAKVDPKWAAKVRHALMRDYDIMVADGLDSLSGKVMRIGHMGTGASHGSVSALMGALAKVLPTARGS